MEILPSGWHWLGLGLLLVGLEALLQTFLLLWFGLGALITGLVVLLSPNLGWVGAALIWITATCLGLLLGRRHMAPAAALAVGQSREGVGREGLLVTAAGPDHPGRVRFAEPFLGDYEWEADSEVPLAAGTRVTVRRIEGNRLKIDPATEN